jgi:hypothetical protein
LNDVVVRGEALARADCRGAGDLQGGGGQVRGAHCAGGAAGEQPFVDYAGQSIGYGGAGDRAQIFVATLGASNYTFARATAQQRFVDWTGALVRALEYIRHCISHPVSVGLAFTSTVPYALDHL